MIREGDRVCNVGRRTKVIAKAIKKGSGGLRPIWTGAIYVARARKDGVLSWRRDGSFGEFRPGHEPSDEFIQLLKSIAPYPWLDEASYGVDVTAGEGRGKL